LWVSRVIDAPNRRSEYSAGGASAGRVYNAALGAIVVIYFLALYYFRISDRTVKLDFGAFLKLDFGAFYTWSYAARIGLNPYSPDAVMPLASRLGVRAVPANYPPPFILAIEPLSLVPRIEAFWLWHGINLCLLLIAVWMLVADLHPPQKRIAFACAALLYGPVTDALFWGQVEPFLLLMLVIALRKSAARRDIASGIAVGLAALCKIYPVVLLGYFLFSRRWTVVASAGLTILVGILLSIAAFGSELSVDFLHQISMTAGDKLWSNTLNASLGAIVAKSLWLLAGHDYGLAMKVLRTALIVLAVSAVLLMTIRGTLSAKRRGDDSIGFGLWVAATVLLTPVVWPHHLTILLIPLRLVIGDVRYKSGPAFRLAIFSYCAAEVELLLGWLRLGLWPHYYFPIQIATVWAILLAVLLAFCAAYAAAIGSRTVQPASARSEFEGTRS
jgi:Glycosyltransferase family 87